MSARTSPPTEGRGWDGRPRHGVPSQIPGAVLGSGLDHGVFVPFIRMFGSTMPSSIPIVEASIDESLSPEEHFAIGQAMSALRKEGYLVIAGGLTVHTRMDGMSGFSAHTAKEALKVWDRQVAEAVAVSDVSLSALFSGVYIFSRARESRPDKFLSSCFLSPSRRRGRRLSLLLRDILASVRLISARNISSRSMSLRVLGLKGDQRCSRRFMGRAVMRLGFEGSFTRPRGGRTTYCEVGVIHHGTIGDDNASPNL